MIDEIWTGGIPGRITGLLLAATLVVGCNSSSNPPPAAPTEPTVAERLQATLDRAVSYGLPGAVLAVRSDGFSFDGAAGVEELATAVPLTVNHRFYLASVGKTYTAVAMVRMAADGLLNLDDPITRWLPAEITDRIPFADAISIRNLLNHTSGIVDFRGDEWDEAFTVDPTPHWANADVLPFFLDKPLLFAPAMDYGYSNSNYVLAALIAEAAAGMPIQNIIRNYIIAPLGLQDTVHGYEAPGLPGFAHGYLDIGGAIIDTAPWYSHYGVSDGGIQSSAADLSDFVRRILASDTILDDAMRMEFLAPTGLGNPPSIYGLGIEVMAGPAPGSFIYHHAGKNEGYQAFFIHVESGNESTTLSLCVSATLGNYDAVYQQLYGEVLEILSDAELIPGA